MVKPELRWLQKEWIHEASKLEWSSSEKFWNIDHFHSILSNKDNRKNVIPLVCIVDDNIAGYNVYKLSKNSYNIINLVVNPEYRRQGIGSLLVQNIVTKLETNSDKSFIKVRVRDTNEIACEFLESQDFRFAAVVEKCFVVYGKTGGTNMKQNAYEYIYKKS
jgi:ribosomal protein S18 acetylase RimI-like enzyme